MDTREGNDCGINVTATRQFEIAASHRLSGYPGACKNLHGHNYVVQVTVSGKLDKLGMVLDFSIIKQIAGGWLNDNWDHACMINSDDTEMKDFCISQKQRLYVFDKVNPTAENMVIELFNAIRNKVPSNIELERVRIYETSNSWVEKCK